MHRITIPIFLVVLCPFVLAEELSTKLEWETSQLRCYQRMLHLWSAAHSYTLVAGIGDMKQQVFPEMLKGYVGSNGFFCPLNGKIYGSFEFRVGPKCPNGHATFADALTNASQVLYMLKLGPKTGQLNWMSTNKNVTLRRVTAYSAGCFQPIDTAEMQPAMNVLLRDADDLTRALAVNNLINYHGLWVEELLLKALSDNSTLVRFSALEALSFLLKQEKTLFNAGRFEIQLEQLKVDDSKAISTMAAKVLEQFY